ncbi:hypothetical protein [Nocardia pneumoniae]|nr:hypothetical protein [Nocardia pneumoniae]
MTATLTTQPDAAERRAARPSVARPSRTDLARLAFKPARIALDRKGDHR